MAAVPVDPAVPVEPVTADVADPTVVVAVVVVPVTAVVVVPVTAVVTDVTVPLGDGAGAVLPGADARVVTGIKAIVAAHTSAGTSAAMRQCVHPSMRAGPPTSRRPPGKP